MIAPISTGNLHRSWEPPSPQSRSFGSPGKVQSESETHTNPAFRTRRPRESGPGEGIGPPAPLTDWLPQLCPAPCFPLQSLTLGFPLSLHPDGEGLSPTQEDKPFPTNTSGIKLVRAPGTRGTSSPHSSREGSVWSPWRQEEKGARGRRHLPQRNFPKFARLTVILRERKRAGHQTIAKSG